VTGRIVRSREDRVIAGVCGGIAAHLGWSASRFRLAYAAVSVLSAAFPGILLYAALWYLMPDAPSSPRRFTVDPPGE
jgi:phage shock protein C